jgi:hypothetical protein
MDGALGYRLTLLTGDNPILRNEEGYFDARAKRSDLDQCDTTAVLENASKWSSERNCLWR